jgi:hypothetical protein
MLQAATLAIVWPPYAGSSALLLSLLLVLVGIGLVMLGRRMTKEVNFPKMGKIVGAIVVVIWAFSILTFLKINKDLARYTGAAGNLGPIFPITLATAFCTFAFVAYVSRRDSVLASLGNGFLAFIAGPMVFEFPFLLIVIPRVKAPLVPALIFLVPLFTIIFTTLAMLMFSRRVAITKSSVYLYAAMIFVFAVWALEGYSYPSNPTAFTLNAISKVLGFAAVGAMFVTKSPEESRKKLELEEEKQKSASQDRQP